MLHAIINIQAVNVQNTQERVNRGKRPSVLAVISAMIATTICCPRLYIHVLGVGTLR